MDTRVGRRHAPGGRGQPGSAVVMPLPLGRVRVVAFAIYVISTVAAVSPAVGE
jgi:hypothetical protein